MNRKELTMLNRTISLKNDGSINFTTVGDPKASQFEPSLAWLDRLRRTYEKTTEE